MISPLSTWLARRFGIGLKGYYSRYRAVLKRDESTQLVPLCSCVWPYVGQRPPRVGRARDLRKRRVRRAADEEGSPPSRPRPGNQTGGTGPQSPWSGPPHRHKRQTDPAFLVGPVRLETETIRLEAGNLLC